MVRSTHIREKWVRPLSRMLRHMVAGHCCCKNLIMCARWMQCSKFHSGPCILLGDSAHAVTSTLGQVPHPAAPAA